MGCSVSRSVAVVKHSLIMEEAPTKNRDSAILLDTKSENSKSENNESSKVRVNLKQLITNQDPEIILNNAESHFKLLENSKNEIDSEEFALHIEYLRECTISAVVTRRVRTMVADKLTNLGLAKLWKELWHKLCYLPEHQETLKQLLYILWNSSDCNPLLCQDIQKNQIHIDLIEYIGTEKFIPYRPENKQKSIPFFIKGCYGILHNTIQACDIRSDLREHRAVQISQAIRDYPDTMIQCKACILLAYIINENESSEINLNDKLVSFLVSILKDSLKKSDHVSARYGFNSAEVLSALNKVAVNDVNKNLIIKAEALQYYVQMMQSDCSSQENKLAAQGLWTLSFTCSESIKNEPGCLEGRLELSNKSNISMIWQILYMLINAR